MKQHSLTWLMCSFFLAALTLAVPQAAQARSQAADFGWHHEIDGVSIYLGVLPIQMARNEADELKLPDKVYQKKNRYYVLFAMFDEHSGKRITDASVKARVEALGGLDFSEKSMTPIHIEKMISYGNYFKMADPDIYHIKLWVKRPGQPRPVSTTFDYRRPEN